MAENEVAMIDGNNDLQKFNWTNLNPAQMRNIATAMALSGMFPDIQKDSAKAFVKIMAGQEMGIPPFQAMSDISIIAGKASAGGNIYASKVKGHPKYDYIIKNWTNRGCAIEFFQIEPPSVKGGRPIRVSLGTSQFDESDAKRAGLLGKVNWKTYPRNMYFNRAMTSGVRTYTPDALGGINAYTPEELGANVDEEGNFVSMDEPDTKASPVTVESTADAPIDLDKASPLPDEPEEEDIDTEATHDFSGDNKTEVDHDKEESITEEDIEESAKAEPEADPKYTVPEYKKGNTDMIRPEMRKDAKKLYELVGIKTAKETAEFNQTIIGRIEAADFFEMLLIIEALTDKANSLESGE